MVSDHAAALAAHFDDWAKRPGEGVLLSREVLALLASDLRTIASVARMLEAQPVPPLARVGFGQFAVIEGGRAA